MKKVKYIASDSIMLGYPISTGQQDFYAGVEYEVNDADFNRLTMNGEFVEVVPERKKTVTTQPVRVKDESKDETKESKTGEDN